MTAACGGGTSSPAPGFGASVVVGAAQLAALFNNLPTALAFAVAGYIGLVSYELSTFCSTDPPALPVLTATDYVDLLSWTDPVAHLAAVQKFQNWYAAMLWSTFCRCDSGSTPAPPALPPPPANLPQVDPPGLPASPTNANCWSVTQTQTVPPASGQWSDWTTVMWSDGISRPANNSIRKLPPGATYFSVHAVANPGGATPNNNCYISFQWHNSSGLGIQTDNNYIAGPPPADTTWTIAVPAGAADVQPIVWFWRNGALNPTPTSNETITVTLYCAGQSPAAPISQCCPPDPTLQAQVDSILSYLQLIYAGLPTSLTSYAAASVHSSLSGDGTLTLLDAPLAVRIDITTDRPDLRVDAGVPNYLFDRGYIVPVVNTAPVHGPVRLVYNPQLFVLPALTEQIGYSLSSGIVISITELVRGP